MAGPDGGFGPPPRPRPSRNLTGILAGGLLVVFCAAAVATYTARLGHRHAVLVVTRAVSAGAALTDADLGEVRLPADPALHPVAASQRSRVVGRVTSVNLAPGTLLADNELATGPQADRDHAVVGLALKSGQYPSGLRPLDRVLLVDTGPGVSTDTALDTSILVDSAQVTATAVAGDGQTTIVSVLVPRTSAAVVVAAAARSRVSVVLLGGPPTP